MKSKGQDLSIVKTDMETKVQNLASNRRNSIRESCGLGQATPKANLFHRCRENSRRQFNTIISPVLLLKFPVIFSRIN